MLTNLTSGAAATTEHEGGGGGEYDEGGGGGGASAERAQILDNFTSAILKRGLSDTFTPVIMNLERTALGNHITMNNVRAPPAETGGPLRRCQSFDLDPGILTKERPAPPEAASAPFPQEKEESFEDSHKTYVLSLIHI